MTILRGFTLLLALQMVGEVLTRLLALPIPGPVIGLLLLIGALTTIAPLRAWVEPAGDALLAHLSLLFVPAGVGVVVHLGRLDGAVIGVVVTLACSTLAGLVATGCTLHWLMRGRATRDSTASDPSERR